ncbi:MAG: hypothetical protein ACO3EZ_11560 [Prochlorotrichaceae cyanobacterium]
MFSSRSLSFFKNLIPAGQVCVPIVATALLTLTAVSPKAAWAQRIVEVTPSVDSQEVSPEAPISGLFQVQPGESIVLNSVKIQVNGTDVTAQSTITQSFFSYRPSRPLPLGENVVRVEYANPQGVRRAATWRFQVSAPVQEIIVDSVTHNATDAALEPGQTLLSTITGTPGAKASVYLVQTGQPTQAIGANEVSPGVYVATWVAANNRPGKVIVVGQLEKQGSTRYAVAAQSLQLNNTIASAPPANTVQEEVLGGGTPTITDVATAPLKPAFTSHTEGQEVRGSEFILKGTTRPGATVKIKVTAIPPRLNVGGIFSVGLGNSRVVMDQTMTSTVNGDFEIPVRTADPAGTRYEVEAIATEGGLTSTPQRLNLIQR